MVLLTAATFVQAQIKVDAPGVVGLNEQFNVTFTLSEKPSSFEWTQGDNFQLVWGPQTGQSTSISIVNGKTSKESKYTYTYVLLPRKAGVFSLPAAHAVVSGDDLYSKAPKIEVVSDGAGSSAQAGQPAQSSQAEQSRETASSRQAGSQNDIFMRFSLSRTSAVVGEPITATLKLFTRGSIAGFEDAKFPSFNGFWAQEVEAPQNIEFRRESVDDKIYNTAVLRRWVLIPQKSGVISIDPAELVCLVQQRVSVGGNSIFDGFFDDYQTFRKRVLTSAYKVNVTPLPSGAPSSFGGAVGKFTVTASLGKDSLKVHDAASLTVTVSGKGNVALVSAPKVNFPPDSEVYDVKTSDKMEAGSGGTSGTRTFEYPFIPRSHGDFVIEPIEFTYYDINSRKYVTLKTAPIEYSVKPGESSDYVPSGGVNIPVSSRKDVKNLSEDIHYIATKLPELSSQRSFLVGTGLFIFLALAIVALAVLAYFLVSKLRRDRADVALVRTRGASKAARKRLAMAAGYLDKNLYSAFYEELHKALLGYAADKLNIGAADLSKESIAAAFASAGAPAELIGEYTAILDVCEFARYSPEGGNAAMKESYDKAAEIISSLDANMKKQTGAGARKLLILVLLLAPGTMLHAGQNEYVDSLWTVAVNAYADGDYALASDKFTAIESLGLASPELYTNIADANFKQRNVARAILYYERALKLDPSDKDARYNLEIARQLTQDRIDSVPEFFLRSWSRKLCYALPSNVWATLFLVLLALGCVLTVIFLLSSRPSFRRLTFFAAIAAFLLCIPCIINANWQKNDYERRDTAIIFRPVCSAKSAPSGANDLFILHEGTKVRILDSVGDWTNIVLSDGREGWVLTRDITVI